MDIIYNGERLYAIKSLPYLRYADIDYKCAVVNGYNFLNIYNQLPGIKLPLTVYITLGMGHPHIINMTWVLIVLVNNDHVLCKYVNMYIYHVPMGRAI